MKRTVIGLSSLLVVFAAVFAVLVLRPVPKVKAGTGCSNLSLHGNYALVLKGALAYYGYRETWDVSMLANFNGEGTLSATNVWGAWWAYGIFGYPFNSFSKGTYTVNPDCTVTMTIPSGVGAFFSLETNLNGILSDHEGDEVKGTAYNTYLTATFRAKKALVD